ncbi:hypothetical protein IE53DRAFT_343273 [Violaceomyces palustris]|uniref:Uncharacterized protein n=1 Tax=Violaceomyces palustris TaxID=1673888 RepID=A0ACD0NYD3_9BASI|nr:hypothetical protein IE53DRAFT_343273 [Violaceomyces palustris]
MKFPLDIPGLSALQQLHHLPYPSKPEGLAIPEWLFEASLSAWTPAAVGVAYLVSTHATNTRFGNGKPKPADLVKDSYFLSQAVLAHNILLAVFSGWTFVNVAAILAGYFGKAAYSHGTQGLVNAYCTVPVHDASIGGMGIYVWLFYASKYYEIVDSIILILKGKPVSNLQSYHHAGAMACMWAAYRYSASAVFIFLLFNSLVHTLMYTYYSMTALKLPFTGGLKRSMTTIQITQLVVGVQLAASYLFIRFQPFSYPSGSLPSPGRTLPDPSWSGSASSKLFNSAYESNSTATADLLDHHSIRSSGGGGEQTPCVSTTGQFFAVLLNVIYLLPLIYLFVSFYIRSYRKSAAGRAGKAGGSKGSKAL